MRHIFFSFLIAATHFNISWAATPNWETFCIKASKTEFPGADRPSAEQAKALAECASVDLYFGIGRPADPALARQCAYVEMGNGDELIWGGSSILIMAYANGRGATRNLDLAIRLACENDLAPGGGQAYRIEHLARLREENWEGNDFSICDDTTSGYWEGNCAWLDARIADAKRETELKRLTGDWNETERKAFAILRTDFERFVESRASHEVDASGTARAMLAHQEETSLRDGFLSLVEVAEHNTVPVFSAAQLAEADRELNRTYRQIQSDSEFSYGTVTRDGIKKTQRLWLKYRDAWVAFGRHKYPAVSPDLWKVWLNRERTKMLSDYLAFSLQG